MDRSYLRIGDEVQTALAEGQAIVALESTIISHGMPYPENVETALQVESVVREAGAIPATIGILDGQMISGAPYCTNRTVGKGGFAGDQSQPTRYSLSFGQPAVGSNYSSGYYDRSETG